MIIRPGMNTIVLSSRAKRILYTLSLALMTGGVVAYAQPTDLVFNLSDPSKIAVLPGGSFLVAQPGARPNFGTVTFFDQVGDQAPLLLGLPFAGRNRFSTAPSSTPDGLAVNGNTLFIATAQIVATGANPPSPQLAAILRATFSRPLANEPGPFFLQPSDFQTLLGGATVTLTQGANNTVTISLAANGINRPSDLTVDTATNRLYIVSRVDGTISFLPLQ